MDKFAQDPKRGLFNELREKANMPSAYLEGFFRPEVDRIMKALSDLDDKIRANLSGQKIGNASAPEDGTSAKDLVKKARTNFNRREYIAGFADLAHFDKKMSEVANDIITFQKIDLDSVHTKFLFNGLPKDYEEKLQHTREYMNNKKAEVNQEFLVKQAAIGGLMDFLANIGTNRGRSLMAWEKKYPNKTKALREGGMELVEQAQSLLENTIANLKKMATARATRRPDDYVDIAQSIAEGYKRFDQGPKGFRNYYAKAIKPFLDVKDAIEAKQKIDEEKRLAEEKKKQEEANMLAKAPAAPAPPTPVAPSPASTPVGPPPGVTTQSPPFAPAKPKEQSAQLELFNHQRFYQSLKSLGNEEPRILASYITKYAKSIQETDLVTAVKLFNIVKRIKQ